MSSGYKETKFLYGNIFIFVFLGWGRKFIVLLDSDDEGEKQKRRYIDNYGLALSELIYTYKDVNEKWHNFETEKLFASDDKLKIIQYYYKDKTAIEKKFLNRCLQELNMNQIKLEFSDQTLDNFKLVLEFIQEKLS